MKRTTSKALTDPVRQLTEQIRELRSTHCARYTATLSVLDAPLTLIRGSIPVVIERREDGEYTAHFTEARLFGEGASDADAIENLAENILAFVNTVSDSVLGGAAAKQWRVLSQWIAIGDLKGPRSGQAAKDT